MARRPKKKAPQSNQTLTGILRKHPRGFGFVVPDNPQESDQDIFIPKHLIHNAVDGDLVEVEIGPNHKPEKGPEGAIVSILNRAKTHLVGTVTSTEGAHIAAHVATLGEEHPVIVKKKKKNAAKVGDRICLKILDWGGENTPTLCEIDRIIGHISDPSCDIAVALEEYGLSNKFPKAVIQEAKTLGRKVAKEELSNRLDLTKTTCITIDPDTAKDFDDALSITKSGNGHFFLEVHIADVAHYVRPNSALDQEATQRSNSTYFPGTCVPMLPEELSNNLCSLRQGVIRLTVSVLMEFNPKGELVNSQIERSYIKSKKRLTYNEAKEILDGKRKSPHASAIKQMAQLCKLLKEKRNARGSIDFALPELILNINENGQPTGVKIEEYHITHQLVEEFMLKANEVVAKNLADRGKSLIFRVHEEPASENLEAFFTTARQLGFFVPPDPSPKDLQNLFDQARNTAFSQQLAVGFIRTLKLAVYSAQNVGHYGLALEHYCHFTSPIRRYSDLIIQRLLFDEEPKDLDLEQIAQNCSDKERVSFRAEMSVKGLKKYRLLQAWIKEDPKRRYPAYITRIKPFGIFFEIRELFLEGFLHISELENDYFIFNPKTSLLQGEKTGIRYEVGSEVYVRPTLVDLIYMGTKWEIAQ